MGTRPVVVADATAAVVVAADSNAAKRRRSALFSASSSFRREISLSSFFFMLSTVSVTKPAALRCVGKGLCSTVTRPVGLFADVSFGSDFSNGFCNFAAMARCRAKSLSTLLRCTVAE